MLYTALGPCVLCTNGNINEVDMKPERLEENVTDMRAGDLSVALYN
jgi:hypothetical protein